MVAACICYKNHFHWRQILGGQSGWWGGVVVVNEWWDWKRKIVEQLSVRLEKRGTEIKVKLTKKKSKTKLSVCICGNEMRIF